MAIRMAIGYAYPDNQLLVGQSVVSAKIENLGQLFSQLNLNNNEDSIRAFFNRPMANPLIFTNFGVNSTPSIIRKSTVDFMVGFFQSDFHDGSILLIFKDKQWHILDRFSAKKSSTLINLGAFLSELKGFSGCDVIGGCFNPQKNSTPLRTGATC